MPELKREERKPAVGVARSPHPAVASLFSECANPGCRTSWVRLWRSRRYPVFEGKWACSADCLEALVAMAVRREQGYRLPVSQPRRHRLPMGLMLVGQGRLASSELQRALDQQRREAAESGTRIRLGEWLVRGGLLDEPALTRALSAQWNCPILAVADDPPEAVAAALPRFLAETFGVLPLRTAWGRLLYVAYAGPIDRSVNYAMERIAGLRVIAGIAADGEFREGQARYLRTAAPRTRYLEAASPRALVRAIARIIEREKPADARLVRVHDMFWLRMWRQRQRPAGLPAWSEVEDLLAAAGFSVPVSE